MNRRHWLGSAVLALFTPLGTSAAVTARCTPSRRGGAGLEEDKAGGDAGLRPWDGLIDE
jgi:hypothetical protein